MTELATLIEKRRIVQARLDMPIRRKKSEIEKLEEEKAALDRAIECVQIVEGDCQNGK